MAFFVLNMSTQDVANLSRVLVDAKDKVKHCSNCYHLSANDPCEICTNDKRDIKTICVVADSRDVIALEKTREYKGSYHVLNGLISPLEGRGPEQLRVRELLQRTGSQEPKEIILAINPTIEGDATVLYLSSLLKPLPIKITRIAFGLPVGSDLEFADEVTLTRALEGRREV